MEREPDVTRPPVMDKAPARCVLGAMVWFTVVEATAAGKPAWQEVEGNRVVIASVVGCLTEKGSGWWLTSATAPVESQFQLSSAIELRNAESTPLGDRQYRLLGVRFFKPEGLRGRKVFIKGAVVPSAPDRAVNVTSLQLVNFVCTE
jgi:hypothetical protein